MWSIRRWFLSHQGNIENTGLQPRAPGRWMHVIHVELVKEIRIVPLEDSEGLTYWRYECFGRATPLVYHGCILLLSCGKIFGEYISVRLISLGKILGKVGKASQHGAPGDRTAIGRRLQKDRSGTGIIQSGSIGLIQCPERSTTRVGNGGRSGLIVQNDIVPFLLLTMRIVLTAAHQQTLHSHTPITACGGKLWRASNLLVPQRDQRGASSQTRVIRHSVVARGFQHGGQQSGTIVHKDNRISDKGNLEDAAIVSGMLMVVGSRWLAQPRKVPGSANEAREGCNYRQLEAERSGTPIIFTTFNSSVILVKSSSHYCFYLSMYVGMVWWPDR